MPELKYLVPTLLAVAIIIAILCKDSIKVAFNGMRLKAGNNNRKNIADTKGDGNIVRQGSASKSAADNKSSLKGNNNDIQQS